MVNNFISPSHFYKEIEYNLKIMRETSLDPERAGGLDVGFLDIFENDIKELSKMEGAQKSQIDTVSHTLEEIAARLYDVNPEEMRERLKRREVLRPLIQEKMPIQTLAIESPNLAPALNEIGRHYDYMQVRGDGHCFFRALSYILLKIKPEQLLSYLDDEEQPESVTEEESASLREYVNEVVSEEVDPLAIMKDETKSDAFVAYLRKCATSWLHKNMRNNEVFIEEIRLQQLTVDRYLQEMTDMEQRKHAGHPEIEALKQIFNIDPLILDANVSLEQREETLPHHESGSHCPLALLLREDHYDIAVPKETR